MTAVSAPSQAQPQSQTAPEKRHGNMPMNMVTTYVFFQLERDFRLLPEAQRKAAKEAASKIINDGQEKAWIRTYSTFGLREDSDFFFWFVAKQVEPIHEIMRDLYASPIGPYLKQTYNYVAVSKESDYVKDHEHEQVAPNEDAPYLFVYPFIKTREWYLQPFERRMEMMREHIAVGHEFPKVTINTSYSFGIDDQDFVVAFDGHNLEEFVKLVMKLRETEASRYTECDKPMFIGLKNPIETVLDSLGI